MEWYEIEIEQIKTLKEFYNFLDKNAITLAKDHDLIDSILRFKNQTSTDTGKQYLQYEVEAFIFQVIGKKVFSFTYSNGTTVGQVLEFPKLDEFQNTAIDYLISRCKKSKSTYLKARYNHLLWKSLKKNNTYAEESIRNYLLTIKKTIPLFKSSNDGYSSFIGRLHECLLCLVSETKSHIAETKSTTRKILFGTHILPLWLKQKVINNMVANPKIFKSEDFTKCLLLFKNERNKSDKKDDFHWVNFMLPTAITIAQKTKSNISIWHEEIGDANVRMAEEEQNSEESRVFIKMSLYANAIEAYRISGNLKKKVVIEQKYFELKPLLRLANFQIDYDAKTISILKQHDALLKKNANEILKNNPNDIYSFISKGSFFPKRSSVEEASKVDKSSFLDFATSLYFDQHKNLGKEKKEDRRRLIDTYDAWMNHTLLPYLHYLVIPGIKSGRLTVKNLFKHLVCNSWIGKPKVFKDFDGNPQYTHWIHIISPSIVEFYNQVIAWGESEYYHPNFILCTDSLALKLEGLFRDFSGRFGVSTSKGKRKGMEESQIHDIIHNKSISKYFNEDDFLFFDYVFSSDGLNIRNNIAHCLYSEKEYHPDKMLLLMAVLLRLGKYNIIRTNRKEE